MEVTFQKVFLIEGSFIFPLKCDQSFPSYTEKFYAQAQQDVYY